MVVFPAVVFLGPAQPARWIAATWPCHSGALPAEPSGRVLGAWHSSSASAGLRIGGAGGVSPALPAA